MTLCSNIGYLFLCNYISNKFDNGIAFVSVFSLLIIRKERKKKRKEIKYIERLIKDFLHNDSIAQIIDYNNIIINDQFYDQFHDQFYDQFYDYFTNIVLEKMEEYFNKFKQSNSYRELRRKFSYMEITNERLELADLI